MRLRNIKGSDEIIAASPYTISADSLYYMSGKWQKKYGREKIFVEIGMGKGKFIIEMAEKHPDYLFIGIEKYSSVLLRAIQKQEDYQLNNLILLRMDAEDICKVFEKEELDGIFLNFSDPWPKDRHAQRRLTSTSFLKRYKPLLKEEAVIEFKTDNTILFDFSLKQVEEAGWQLLYSTYDLHSDSEQMKNNVMTEYEEKFSSLGYKICKYIIRK